MIFTTAAFASPKHKRFEHFDKKYEIKIEEYEDALQKLINNEIVKGYGNGDYGLSGNVKRGDVIVMIMRMLEKYEDLDIEYDDVEEVFEDVYKNDYFYGSIAKAKKLGIAKGDGKYFNPNKPVTVKEAILLVDRAGEKLGLNVTDKIIDELETIYEGELDKFAKRRDIFWMIYYVLDLVEYEEPDDEDSEETDLADIKLNMSDEDEIEFLDEWFAKAFNDLMKEDSDVEDLDYIKFDMPVKNGKLYYNYDADDGDDNDLVDEEIKYYTGTSGTNRVDKITLVPNDNYSGTVTVKYYAYDEDGESYEGYMKITVENDMLLEDVEYKALENETVTFDKDDFESFLEEVQFVLPNSKIGTLYFDDDKDGKPEDDELVGKSEKLNFKDLDNIIFVPYIDYDGKVVIKYIGINHVENEEDDVYSGEVIITVSEVQEITTLRFNAEYDDDEFQIDFYEKLEDQVNDDDLMEDFDYVKFAEPEEGTLKIKLDGSKLKDVDIDNNYDIEDIEYIKYVFESKGDAELIYTVYDDDTEIDKAYDGKFVLTIK
jgi:hypothetical protein